MSKLIKEIAWVAGLIEGEGSFGINNNSPKLAIAMTDLDVLEKARDILDKTKKISTHEEPSISKDGCVRKTRYTLTLTGGIAIQWMMTIYPMMGLRRKTRIHEMIHHWKTKMGLPYGQGPHASADRARTPKNDMIKIFMSTGCSREEAEIKTLEVLMKVSPEEK